MEKIRNEYSRFLKIRRRPSDSIVEEDVREEIYSLERLEAYARQLAGELSVESGRRRGRPLLPGIRQSGRQLLTAYRSLAEAIRQRQSVSPAAEWFVDNFHIVEDQLRDIRHHLPPNYYHGLPKLDRGELKGFPRVYALALALLTHTDCRLDAETIRRFLRAFQEVSPLTIGELWAVAISLRIGLVQNLTPLALRIVHSRRKREEANELADRLLALAAQGSSKPDDLVAMLSAGVGDHTRFDRPQIVQLIQRLRDQDPDLWPAFDWLETQLRLHNTTSHRVTQLEHHRQATAQVTVGNIISSMRFLSALDWKSIFEDVSLVDPILSDDPSRSYSRMDFATRDDYRHAIERLAMGSGFHEHDVARKAIERSRQSHFTYPADARRAHVGFYLVDEGVGDLEKLIGYRSPPGERIGRFVRRHPSASYLGGLALLTALPLAVALVAYAREQDEASILGFLALAALALLPATDFAVAALNSLFGEFLSTRRLPKIDTESGIPGDARTMVVIPTLFTSEAGVRELAGRLEVHYLANQDDRLHFALIGDYGDGAQEKLPKDEALLALAASLVEALNARYPSEPYPRFHLFHRARRWNPSEGKWMGWERKRGKLEEFNRLLRGATDTSYVVQTAPATLLGEIRYVITLDSDTQLPRNAARRLVGTALHPLNRPEYDPKLGRVTRGHAIFQPRISVAHGDEPRTRFARIFSGHIGIDPYSTAVSDVYQDLVGEGSFTGKGLYVVDEFELALRDRVPENHLLSHDLFEGAHARSALVSDIELFDDYPDDFGTWLKRQHRWIRGDWQIVDWLLDRVPDVRGQRIENPLTLFSRWKIFDNLRRSLAPAAQLLALVAAWTRLPGSPGAWTLGLVAVAALPLFAPIAYALVFRRGRRSWAGHLRGLWAHATLHLQQFLVGLALLPDIAYAGVDAVVRTAYRRLVSKRNLLEWVSFAQTRRDAASAPWRERLGVAPIVAAALPLILATRPEAIGVALPFLAVWLTLPWLRGWLETRPKTGPAPLNGAQIAEYRSFARRTWNFFESFVTADNHYLAPDNFQEDPHPVVAQRTSPTNMGLQLLSAAAAYDLGFVAHRDLLEGCERTLETLQKLPRYRGHFYNWYDTSKLEPLRPLYVSTVDSGNLAGHLLAFKQFGLELAKRPAPSPATREGLRDTLRILCEEATARVVPTSTLSASACVHFIETLKKARLAAIAPEASFTQIELILDDAHAILHEIDPKGGLAEGFGEVRAWIEAARKMARAFAREESDPLDVGEAASRWESVARVCERLAHEMDFAFLFDRERKIFTIGYNVTDARLDNSFYDLLASEARLTSFYAIAKGDVPLEHWFRLGRQMAPVPGGSALISWTATMFEYLMPLLVMRVYDDTLLAKTYSGVLARQREYGDQRDVPWGISEAGYNARDLQLNYQYGPFGVPGLGLKRGLSDDLVVSPYSTMLAAMVDPHAALENLRRLADMGVLGRRGFYESVDYTAGRLPQKQTSFVLRSYMAHHQGMSLVAMDNLLNENVMQRRFHAEPLVRSTQLLLQEKIPVDVELTRPRAEEVHSDGFLGGNAHPSPRVYRTPSLGNPRTQILSNGSYSLMVSSAGGGYSRCGRLAVNRWREDATRDHWGQFLYVRHRESGRHWSATFQPTLKVPRSYEAIFSEEKVEFRREDDGFQTHTEILVSPEDNVEMRRVSLTNNSDADAEFELTSYLEVALSPPADDAAHPAFSNLFVQTEFHARQNTLLATRRRRSEREAQAWGFHAVAVDLSRAQGSSSVGSVQYETDRSRFLGRGHDPSGPSVLVEGRPLSNTTGSVLDPIFSIRQSIRIAPNSTVRVLFSTGVTDSRAEAVRLADKYHDPHMFLRANELAWTQSQVQLRHLNVSSDKAHVYQRLAGSIIYPNASLRPRSHVLAQNAKAQSSLWVYGISGDVPIVLTSIRDEKDMAMVRELLHAHEYLRLKGLAFDLVLLNERSHSYLQTLQDELHRQIRISGSQGWLDKPGGIFLRRSDLIPAEDLLLLQTVARVRLAAEQGSLEEQLKRRETEVELPPPLSLPAFRLPSVALAEAKVPPTNPGDVTRGLKFFNGLGGFREDGREYVIVLENAQWTPAPWINVVANSRDFGFIVSESGSSYTWFANSRENRLTPWSNDPVSDPPGEIIYVRDEDSGALWTPTPLPIRRPEPYVIRHGAGYSSFESRIAGIEQKLLLFVPREDGVKIARLTLTNRSAQKRRLSVTNYVEWVLGFQRGSTAPYVITEATDSGALLARNPYNNEFAGHVAFADINLNDDRSFTCDRREFIGRNGSLAAPAGLARERLAGQSGAGLDPCAALQAKFDLKPGESKEVIVLLGQAETREKALEISQRYRDPAAVETAYSDVTRDWHEVLTQTQIRTPDAAMDTMVNHWLLYQTLSCRVWARSAFYQSGGAYGFRDQLQDVMALVHSRPAITREQILRAARRQFPEGDVQHWWHPPTGRGVRTRFSDDLLWLPFVSAHYARNTGDERVLDEEIPFISAPELAPGQDDAYTQPGEAGQSASLFEHCARAIDRSLKVGRHGLPLMGSGDWNDGMSRVGVHGQGESVWVAWFLYSTIEQFLPYCESRGESARVARYRKHLLDLKAALERHGWDGDWYRRAFFDDGTPLGSTVNDECRIDSIAQSWSVLSGAAEPQRAARAMAAVDEYLVHRGDGLVKLFDPPFDRGTTDPGYIKGYLPGVRENGGQYTHAALWTLMAFAKLGDGDRAAELYSLLNPVNHASTRAGLYRYKVEPYVAAADVYGLSPHVGRGGWTWYTGSASWMYRAAIESILGLERQGKRLILRPRIPHHWPFFEIDYRVDSVTYRIRVNNTRDGNPPTQTSFEIPLEASASTDITLNL